MKAKIEKDALLLALKIVKRAIPRHTTLSQLKCVLLEAVGTDTIRVSATNLEQYASCEATASVSEPGDVLVPYALFNAMMATFPDGVLDLFAENTGPRGKFIEVPKAGIGGWTATDLVVSQGERNAAFKGLDPCDFPLSPVMENEVKGYVSPDDLATLIKRTAYAAASDQSRPILTGVLFVAEPASELEGSGVLMMGAADGFRLAMSCLEVADLDLEARCVIPAVCLLDLGGLLKREAHPMEVQVSRDQVSLCLAGGNAENKDRIFNIRIVSQLIEGHYVNLGQIVPKDCFLWVTFDRSKLVEAFKAAQVFAQVAANIVTVTLQDNGIDLFAQEAETGETTIPVEGQIEGEISEKRQFTLNSVFALDVLNAVTTATIRMGYNGPSCPVLFTLDERAAYQAVIMPMAVRK